MHWLAVIILLANFSLAGFYHPGVLAYHPAASLQQQSTVEIDVQETTYEFGNKITFRAGIQGTTQTVNQMIVFITPEGQPTVWEEMDVASDGSAILDVDVRQLSLAPFSRVSYRFEASLVNGASLTSETNWFEYTDNRFNWKSKEDNGFIVYWYSDDLALGQEIINIAQQGLQKAQSFLQEQPPQPLRIYAYTSSRDLQSALQLSNQSWIAGHASPELRMILISVPDGPERKLELERQIPHEITHLLQYKMVGSNFFSQPVWLVEGMASLAELYPNPDYRRVLESSVQDQDFIPFRELCSTFPREATSAFRAYAQSESFVSYLHAKFGVQRLRQLMTNYQDGFACEEGFALVYETSLDQVEYRWKQEVLGINTGQLALENLSPYLLLGLLIIIPASLAVLPLLGSKKEE